MKNNKPTRSFDRIARSNDRTKIAIISLTSCNGCLVEIINLGKKLLDILEYVEIVDFPLVEEKRTPGAYDITFIEGSPITKENIEDLRKLRKKTKFLVALGTCASLGGVPEIKNYRDKNKLIKSVYQCVKKIDNPPVLPLKSYVKVDFEIPGCPPNKDEIYRIVTELLSGKIPKIFPWPVCYECQIREYDCLLQKGLPCLGPITLGGCGAICLANKEPCAGCRGFLPRAPIKNFKKLLKDKGVTKKKLNTLLEKFGLKDDYYEILKTYENTKNLI